MSCSQRFVIATGSRANCASTAADDHTIARSASPQRRPGVVGARSGAREIWRRKVGAERLAVVALALLAFGIAPASPASAASRPGLTVTLPAAVRAGDVVQVGGTVRGRTRGRRVILQQRSRGRWIARSQRALGSRRAFALRWRAPSAGQAVRIRVRLRARRQNLATSATKRVVLLARAGEAGARIVITPGAVRAVPPPGSPGTLRYRGVLSVRRGDFLAADVGPATPYGFLGRVVSSDVVGSETRVSTEPTTLLAAVPEGSIDVRVEASAKPRSSGKSEGGKINRAIGKSLSCANGASIALSGTVDVSPGARFTASWTWKGRFPPKPAITGASVTGTITARADLSAVANGAASCTLEKTPLLLVPIKLGEIRFSVGPIPVVIVPQVQVFIDAYGGVQANMTSALHASLTAGAGLEYVPNQPIRPISEFTPRLEYDPPVLTVAGQLMGNVRPTLDLLLYGVGGLRTTFSAGLDLSASTANDPWWKLTAPVALTASLVAPALDLSTEELNVYGRTFDLAEAPGRFGAGAVTEYSAGITKASLYGITRGPDDNLWYTASGAIGRITREGTVTEFPTKSTVNAQITKGPDGSLWFTQLDGAGIGRITIKGVITEFQSGITAGSQPDGITAGPDNNLWFTERRGRIGRITPDGVVTEFAAGITPGMQPGGITNGPDGNLWFTEYQSSGDRAAKIGRITPAGVITEFALPGGLPDSITLGPDGNLWFTAFSRIGRITPAGEITEFPARGHGGIAAGPDGALWFTKGGTGRIGRITTSGKVSDFPVPETFYGPGIAAGPDGNMWYTNSLKPKIGKITTGVPPS